MNSQTGTDRVLPVEETETLEPFVVTDSAYGHPMKSKLIRFSSQAYNPHLRRGRKARTSPSLSQLRLGSPACRGLPRTPSALRASI